MNPAGGAPAMPNCTVMVDEVGIESGRYGPFRLKTVYQPIFSAGREALVPLGVEGRIVAWLDGRPVTAQRFMKRVRSSDLLAVESVCQSLHLKNHRNIGIDRLELFFNHNPRTDFDVAAVLREMRAVADEFGETALDPRSVVCEITNAFAMEADQIAQLVDTLRRAGVRVALDDFGAGYTTEERIERVRPDVVKIEGGWFRRFCREVSTARLLAPSVAGFQHRGAKVLVDGIRTAAHLRVALEAGADLLQGDYLAEARLAGTIFDETPLPLATLLADSPKVVPLFG